MTEILRRRINRYSDQYANEYWIRLEVSDDFIHYFSMSEKFVEYYDIGRHGADDIFFIFALDGARALDGPLHAIRALVARFRQYFSKNKVAKLDYDAVDGEAWLRVCSNDNKLDISGKADSNINVHGCELVGRRQVRFDDV